MSVLYGGLVSGYTARLAGYLSTGGVLTMEREVWDMVSDCGSEEWRGSSLATPPDQLSSGLATDSFDQIDVERRAGK